MAQLDQESRGRSEGSPLHEERETLASLGTAAGEKWQNLTAASREKLEALKKKSLEDLYGDARTFIRQNPGKSLLGGLAVGFLLGRIFRRR